MTILLLLGACDASRPVVTTEDATVAVDFHVTDVPTVYLAVWDTPYPSRGALQYGEGDAWDHTAYAADSNGGLHHEARVPLPAGMTWAWRITNDGSPGAAGVVDVTPAPRQLPVFTVTEGDGSPTDGYIVGASPVAEGASAVWVIDTWGRYVWWTVFAQGSLAATDAQLSADGHWIEWVRGVPGTALHRRKLDGSKEEEFPIPTVHHSFVQLPERGWAVLLQEQGEVDGQPVVGEAIAEVAPDGSYEQVFSSWDTMEVDPTEGETTDAGQDAIHDNGIDYDEDNDRYLVSSHARSSVFAVDRADGALLWELGGAHSDFQLEGGRPFVQQHGPELDSNGDLMLFDNGSQGRLSSRAVAYSFDEDARTYTQTWELEADPSVYSAMLGNPDRQPDGSLFLNWGIAGRLEHFDEDGVLDWRAETDLGGTVGYAHHVWTLLGSTG